MESTDDNGSRAMKHYRITEWTDYVRGVAGGSLGRRMGDHLAGGCAQCGVTQAALREVAVLADKDSRLDLAEGVVRSVKAFFAHRQPERARELKCLALQLVYDSLLQPAPAGVRSSGPTPRRLVFRGEDLALDLVLARGESGSSDLRLNGELVSSEEGPLPDVPALLVEDHEVVDQAWTGSLGNFSILCERPATTHLRLLVRDGEYIDVPLSV